MSYSSLKSKRIQQSLTNILYRRGQWLKLDECSLVERRIAKILLASGNLYADSMFDGRILYYNNKPNFKGG